MPSAVNDKLYFAVYQNDVKKLQHMIVFRKSKEDLNQEIRNNGFLPKGIFVQKEVEDIMAEEFFSTRFSDKVIQYVKDNIADWEKTV